LFNIEEKIMSKIKRGAMTASILMLVAITASACKQPFSQQPVVTNTPINPNSLFATPITGATQMTDVERFATETQKALTTSTPATATPAGVGITPQASATPTFTPIVNLPPTFTPTATLAVSGPSATSGPSLTPLPAGARPLYWTLQAQEFPFCIARRFNVNPKALLDASGLTSPDIYYAGWRLTIPQGKDDFWPTESLGPRALKPHSGGTLYTVTGEADTTVYGVACKFGDVMPSDIASLNGISVDSTLSVGQSLKIP
jgi:hypothetical protein